MNDFAVHHGAAPEPHIHLLRDAAISIFVLLSAIAVVFYLFGIIVLGIDPIDVWPVTVVVGGMAAGLIAHGVWRQHHADPPEVHAALAHERERRGF